MPETADDSAEDAALVAPGVTDEDAPFRARDSMGALRPSHADVDSAFARGYAQGLEERDAYAGDQWRTVLCSILEARFGDLDTLALNQIEGANQGTLERWMVAAISATSLEAVFSDKPKSNGRRHTK